MSAPWEYHLGPSIVGGWEKPQAICASTITFNDVKPVRYLRADLKCAECAYLQEDSDYSVLCTKHSWEIAAENPACMAFKPKEDGK